MTMMLVNPDLAGAGGYDVPDWENDGYGLYWRVVIIDSDTSTTNYSLVEAEMKASAGGADQCSGGTATALGTGGSGTAANLFDDTNSTYWSVGDYSGSWFKYQFTGYKKVAELTMTARTTYPGEAPEVCYLQSSMDNDEWVTRAYITGQTGWTNYQKRTFNSFADYHDKYWDDVVMLCFFDSVIDGATYIPDSKGHALTLVGNAQLDTAQKMFTYSSLLLDGNGDYVYAADSDDFEFADGALTIELCVRIAGYATAEGGLYRSTLVSKDVSGSRGFSLALVGTASTFGSLEFTAWESNSSSDVVSGTYSFALNTWYTIACVKREDTVYLFVDGTLLNAGGTAQSKAIQATTAQLKIGASEYDATYKHYLNGWVDALRITKGVGRWTANYTVMNTFYHMRLVDDDFASVASLMHYEGYYGQNIWTDETGRTWTRYGSAQIIAPTTMLANCYSFGYFDGVGDYLVPGDVSSLFGFGTNDFTIEFWIYLYSDQAQTWPQIMASSPYNSGSGFYMYAAGASTGWGGTGVLTFAGASTMTYYPVLTSTSVVRGAAGWRHIAVTRTGVTTRLFVDGKLEDTDTAAGVANYSTSGTPKLGCAADSTTTCDKFQIMELRVTNGVCRYTADFAPPRCRFPNAAPA